MSNETAKLDTRVSAAFNNTNTRSQEQDSMDGYFQDDEVAERQVTDMNAGQDTFADAGADAGADELDCVEDALDTEADDSGDDLMTIVDPMIDKASRESDDSDLDDDLEDSEFDDDIQFDQLDEFMSDDPDEVDDLTALGSDGELDDAVLDPEMEEELERELKVPLTASQQALEARRAIEERAEARRMERDLNYLDFELDD